ncbi:protein-disulfide isomerase [Kroppenstedtia sanguinis]|uniref:DsbA family protein n=1 Tax=Kroppenstedtia sanguinis TaxID=1380684 RepID=UPI003D25585B
MGKKKQTQSNRMQTLTLVTVIVLFLGLGVYALVNNLISGNEKEEGLSQEATMDEKVFAYDKQPVLGNEDAPVRIVEFGDYKCPTCKRFADEIYPQLKKDYLDNDKAGFYFINNQFLGEDSITAGIAGEAVYEQDPAAFWKFHETIYEHQGDERETWATPEFLVKLAKQAAPGIDHGELAKAIDKESFKSQVEKDKEIGIQSGVQSVPALFINGKPVPDSLDYEGIKQMIEEELKKAK